METFLVYGSLVSFVFLVVMAILLRKRWKREAEVRAILRKTIPNYDEIRKSPDFHEPNIAKGEWKGPGARPDGKEAC